MLKKAILNVRQKSEDKKIIFIKSWNEWGEGNHLEPDLKYGLGYLEAYKKAISEFENIK
ncbi:glycoside hydrolase family 99-like domain-containing protein [Candidatus Stoquefichus massiliensis]|uniref:glycoside hydrolase family 99-like domain-containing protein n=1 Tax=Candidatus Stoquefichus massiliensis TaxID=1470350 RepID=UPI0004ACB163